MLELYCVVPAQWPGRGGAGRELLGAAAAIVKLGHAAAAAARDAPYSDTAFPDLDVQLLIFDI